MVGVEQFGKLLSDGRTAARTLVAAHTGLEYHTHQCADIDTGVLDEARIFSGNKSVDEAGCNILIIGIQTVAVAIIEAPHLLSIGRVNNGSILVDRVLKVVNFRHISNNVVVGKHEEAE